MIIKKLKGINKKWKIVLVILIIGYLLPVVFAAVQGRIVHYHPLGIISTKSRMSECLVEATFQDMSMNSSVGPNILTYPFILRYDVVGTDWVRPYFWFNIPGRLIKVVRSGGEYSIDSCKENPNYNPI